MTKLRNGSRSLIAGIFYAVSNAFTFAQESSNNLLDMSLEDLMQIRIYSAGKQYKTIPEIPASVVVIYRDDLETYGHTTLLETLDNVPGLYSTSTYEQPLLGVRGSLNGGMLFLLNGIPQHPTGIKTLTIPNRIRFAIPVESIDRVEIVRGPMSVIYGNNAFFGSVNIITNEIKSGEHLVSVGIGNNGASRGFFRIAAPYENGSIVFNTGIYQDNGVSGGYHDFMSAEQYTGLAPGMHTKLDGYLEQKAISLDLTASYQDFTLHVNSTFDDFGIYALTPTFNDGNKITLENVLLALNYNKLINDSFTLDIQIIHSEESYDAIYDFIAPNINDVQAMESRRVEFESTLDYSSGSSFSLISGLRYLQIYNIFNDFEIRSIAYKADRESTPVTSLDFFTQANYELNEKWNFVVGGRWSKPFDYKTSQRRDFFNPERITETHTFHTEDKIQFMPRLAVIYSKNEHHIFKTMFGVANKESMSLYFDTPEKIKTLEFNYLTVHGKWSFSGSVFHNHISNLTRKVQRFDPYSGKYMSISNNSGKLETTGVEAIGKWSLTDHFHTQASFTFQKTNDLNNPDITPGNSPNLLVKLKISYHQASTTYALFANFVDDMKSDWVWSNTQAEGWQRIGAEVPSYCLVGINIRHEFGKSGFFANFHVKNLLDAKILYPANELVDFYHGAPGSGQQALLTIGKEF